MKRLVATSLMALGIASAAAPPAFAQRGLLGAQIARAEQRGVDNRAAIDQAGRGNGAAIAQDGAGNTAGIRQYGRNNTGAITQEGDNNAACLVQLGRNLDASIVQTGDNNNIGILQGPRGVHEIPVERCSRPPGVFMRGIAAAMR